MLNENRTFEKQETKSFPLLKNDIYQVELCDINLETKQKYQSTDMEDVLTFEFAILDGADVDGKVARLRLLAKNFVPTYLYISNKTGKNWLYKIVESLINRDLTREEEMKGLTTDKLNSLIGKQCRLLLEKKQSKKDSTKFYSNISNILPSTVSVDSLTPEEKEKVKEYKKPKQTEELPVITIDEIGTDASHFGKLPDEPTAPNNLDISKIPF